METELFLMSCVCLTGVVDLFVSDSMLLIYSPSCGGGPCARLWPSTRRVWSSRCVGSLRDSPGSRMVFVFMERSLSLPLLSTSLGPLPRDQEVDTL